MKLFPNCTVNLGNRSPVGDASQGNILAFHSVEHVDPEQKHIRGLHCVRRAQLSGSLMVCRTGQNSPKSLLAVVKKVLQILIQVAKLAVHCHLTQNSSKEYWLAELFVSKRVLVKTL